MLKIRDEFAYFERGKKRREEEIGRLPINDNSGTSAGVKLLLETQGCFFEGEEPCSVNTNFLVHGLYKPARGLRHLFHPHSHLYFPSPPRNACKVFSTNETAPRSTPSELSTLDSRISSR